MAKENLLTVQAETLASCTQTATYATFTPGPWAFGLDLELPGLLGFQLTADLGTSEPP